MGDNSKIEWTDATWNPLRAHDELGRPGWYCEKVSKACDHCYAEAMNKRLGTRLAYSPSHREDVHIFLDEKTLLQPLHWKRPRKIFVCSMTDLFGDWVPDEMIDRMFAVMALCPQHTFQILTKRPERMREYLSERAFDFDVFHACGRVGDIAEKMRKSGHGLPWNGVGPVVWLGVTAEDQETANARIPILLDTPAAIRFVSCEPMLGPIDLTHINCVRAGNSGTKNTLSGDFYMPGAGSISSHTLRGGPKLDWVICGGESGPHARPMHPDLARSLRNQCAAADVAFHFKQWGEWADTEYWSSEMQEHLELVGKADGSNVRVGKKRAGRLLDGIEHNGFPEARAG